MEQKTIGPSFVEELEEAGGLIGEHFSWDERGNLCFFDDTPEAVVAGVKAVYAAHDPLKPSWVAYQATAQEALAASDITVSRCYENAVSLPEEWKAYRKSLRAIVSAQSGDATQPLPRRPVYPSGT
jgi:hypothetical protein